MTSMADHLLSQQYSRLRKADDNLLMEPRMSDEDAARLVEAYERADTSEAEYLAMVTATRPFTPPSTTHSVLIDCGTYCSTVAMPLVFKSFIQDHGNAAVGEMLSRHEVALVEKISPGGVLVHVRSSEAERKLVGQEVTLLGRKFKIKRQSPFVNKFYLDIFGIRSTAAANALFMGFAALGARPLFLTPRDVNMDAQVTTPTWRFYFGEEQPPSCLMVRGFVTNQLVYGRKLYLARGGRSLAPPGSAGGFKRSPYAVELPLGKSSGSNTATGSGSTCVPPPRLQKPERTVTKDLSVVPSTSPAAPKGAVTSTLAKSPRLKSLTSADKKSLITSHFDDLADGQMDSEMASASSEDDIDMSLHLESGFKRIERSFADSNPFAVLEEFDCDFDVFTPEVPEEMTPGVLLVPSLTAARPAQVPPEPLPTKKRSTTVTEPVQRHIASTESVLVTVKETQLEVQKDRVSQNMNHLDSVHELLKSTKNMDKIAESMQTFPTAWSTAVCSDLAAGGRSFTEVAELHLLDRILLSNIGSETTRSFYQRAVASQLPLGNTRQSYVKFLSASLDGRSVEVKNQWEVLRALSSFELLVMITCPFLFGSQEWLQYFVGDLDEDAGQPGFLSNSTILRLLRSTLGQLVLTKLSNAVPACDILASISALASSNFSQDDIPTVALDSLVCVAEVNAEN